MTDTPKKLVHDIATGKTEYIDLTPEEIADLVVMAQEAEARKHEEESKAAADAEAKASAEAKLSTLGLSAEEIAALTK
jgi:predicted DNA-binding transcriptional regulator YafY